MKIKLGNIAYAVVQMVGNKTNGEGVAFSSEKINLWKITRKQCTKILESRR